MAKKDGIQLGRRAMLRSAAGIAALPLASGAVAQGMPGAGQRATTRPTRAAEVSGRRRLGKLEVSSIGIGVQNIEVRGQRLPDAVLVHSGREAPLKR